MIHAHRVDTGSEKTLVLIHGIAGRCEQLTAFWDVGCNIVAVDLPGHGKSAVPDGDVWEETITSLRALLDEIEHPIVLGYSLGGLIACELVARGAKMEQLILLASAARLPMAEALKNFNVVDRAAEFTKKHQAYILDLIDRYRGFRSMHFTIKEDTDLLTDLAFTQVLVKKDYRITLKKSNIPLTIIHGTSDLIIPILFAEEIAKAVPSATFVRLNENHVSIHDSKKAIAAVKKVLS